MNIRGVNLESGDVYDVMRAADDWMIEAEASLNPEKLATAQQIISTLHRRFDDPKSYKQAFDDPKSYKQATVLDDIDHKFERLQNILKFGAGPISINGELLYDPNEGLDENIQKVKAFVTRNQKFDKATASAVVYVLDNIVSKVTTTAQSNEAFSIGMILDSKR